MMKLKQLPHCPLMSGFSIASWNVHMGLHNDHAGARDTVNRGPLNAVVERCIEIDADVLVLQEARWWTGTPASDHDANGHAEQRSMIDAVAEAVGGTAHTYEGDRPNRYPVPWTIAVISRVPTTRLDDLALPSLWDRTRAMIRVRLDDHDLVLGGGHHDGIHSLLRQPGLWREQWRVMQAAAADNDVMVGDFNMWGPVMARNLPGLRRAVRARTWPAQRPHSQIDHILVNDRVEVVNGSVLPNMDSDHRPIKAMLRRRNRR